MELFLASLTQMRVSMVGPIGLDYAGVQAAAQMSGVEMTPGLFRLIRVAERAYLDVCREERERAKSS